MKFDSASIGRSVQVGRIFVDGIGTLPDESLEQYFNNFGIVVDIHMGNEYAGGDAYAVITFTDHTGRMFICMLVCIYQIF